jgi:hypothetical protein
MDLKGVMMRITPTLTMHEVARFSHGPKFGTGPVFRYGVEGLPPGHQAFINNAGCPNRDDWRIHQWIKNGPENDGNEGYPSAAEALAVLQTEVDAASAGCDLLTGSKMMKHLGVCALLFSSVCWCQSGPVQVAVQKPVVVKLDAPSQSTLLPVLQFGLPVLSALIAVWLTAYFTNRNNRLAIEATRQHEMRKWRAEKQLDVLSRIGLLLFQANHALKQKVHALYVLERMGHDNPKDVEYSVQAHEQLSMKREELGALIGSAGFALSDSLWQRLQSLQGQYIDACDREPSDEKERKEQLRLLDEQIEAFNKAARTEFEAVLPSWQASNQQRDDFGSARG